LGLGADREGRGGQVKTPNRYFVLIVRGGVEVELSKPFSSSKERDKEAKRMHSVTDECDSVFWLDVRKSVITGSYSGAFFEENRP